MGNLTFIVPTKNIEDFTIDKVYSLLKDKFPEFNIVKEIEFNQISILSNDHTISHLYFNQDCYIVDFDQNVKELSEMNMDQLALKLLKLKKLNPDLTNSIQTTHSNFFKEKNTIDTFLRLQFSGYVFDEGIHPEFIPPDYVSKNKDKSLIKKFGKWLLK